MPDISNLKIGLNSYSIKDPTARTTANTNASTAITNAQNANTKIDNSKIVGNYTSATETIEIALEIGSVNNN